MKICDKIREVYQLYQEYYQLLRKRSKELKEESIDIDLFTLDLFDKLAISYFNSNHLGMVISCYCYHNIFANRVSEDYTMYLILEKTRDVVEWYRDHYDSEVEVEEVVGELKKQIEREEERRTKKRNQNVNKIL